MKKVTSLLLAGLIFLGAFPSFSTAEYSTISQEVIDLSELGVEKNIIVKLDEVSENTNAFIGNMGVL